MTPIVQVLALLAVTTHVIGSPCASKCFSQTTLTPRDNLFLLCCVCNDPLTSVVLTDSDRALCTSSPSPNSSAIGSLAASFAYNALSMQGSWFLDGGGPEDNATQCLAHLFTYMPRSDVMVIFETLLTGGLTFLADTVRMSLRSWQSLSALGVPWGVFLDNVLPYAVFNEKRDWGWDSRARFARLFHGVWDGATTITQAMHNLSYAIPRGALDYTNAFVTNASATPPTLALAPGSVIQWHSESSPGFLSPQQVASWAGSCTGTGIVMVAAARAVGIPARLAGCSQTDVPNDDHHWAEFYDPSDPGPFGNFWHTKEGTSKGNEGGPWDSPSGPMAGCLKGVTPNSSLNTMWVGNWGSETFLPTLWQSVFPAAQQWSFLGGSNVCGAYCSAWGCGVNGSKWSQDECWVAPPPSS